MLLQEKKEDTLCNNWNLTKNILKLQDKCNILEEKSK